MPAALFGREREQVELDALLGAERGALLVGPPGIGKSALAAARPDAVVVSVEDVTDAAALYARVARALDCPVDRPAAVREALRGRARLVLDGAEGLEALLDAELDALRERAPVLVTSRRRLALDLPVLELGPLPDPAGAALLRRRAGSARLAASLDEPGLQALSRAFDGVPLALELVAPHLRLHPPDRLRERALAELGGPALLGATRDVCDRLSAGARDLLGVLAALPVAVDAAWLARLHDRPVDAELLELLDASLLHPEPSSPPRFRMLAPIREVAAPDPATRDAALRRLAEVALPDAERAADESPDAPISLRDAATWARALLAATEPEVRARAACVLAAWEHRAGPVSATLDRDRALGDLGRGPAATRWGLVVAAAACQLGAFDHARDALDRVRPNLPDDAEPTWDSVQAMWAMGSGRADEAVALAERAAARDPRCALRLGIVRFHRGEMERAIDAFSVAREGAGPFQRAKATNALCAAMREAGRPSEQILAELDALGDQPDLASFTWLAPRLQAARAIVAGDRGALAEARDGLDAAARGLRALGEPEDAHAMWLDARSLDLALGEPADALRLPPPPDAGPRGVWATALWRCVLDALDGRPSPSDGRAALDALRAGSDPRAGELAAVLAAALASSSPDDARALLDGLDSAPAQVARAAIDGRVPDPPARLEARVVAAIARRVRPRARVRTDGVAFVGADGARVDLGGRRVLCRVLAALASADGPLGVDALCRAVWPGERLVGGSGTRRVHVAISSLRGLGLRDAITTIADPARGTGWALDAERVPPEAL